jgi:nucleoredoxin
MGKLIGLYFGAHWCPPCRAFAPLLTEFAAHHRVSKSKVKSAFEIVYLSWDKSEPEFQEYHRTLGCYAVPLANTDLMVIPIGYHAI